MCEVGVETPGDLNIHYGCAWDYVLFCVPVAMHFVETLMLLYPASVK